MSAASRSASISVVIALMLAAVWLFWPTSLGGSTTYVVTHGISMEPRFHTGDLAIIRPDLTYSIGDVVAYRSESLDTVVMHRIVALDGDRYVIQGDNNDWLDEDHPSDDQVLGRLFLRIPQGGKALQTLQAPWMLGLVGAASLVFAAAGAALPRARRRGAARGGKSAGGTRTPGGARTPRWGKSAHPKRSVPLTVRMQARQVAIGAAVVAGLGAVACATFLLLPTTQTDVRTVQVSQEGHLSYSASAVQGTTYPTGRIETGDPIYTSLVDALTVSFAHTISGADPASARGTVRLDVAVAAPDGWTAPLTSGDPAPLVDDSADPSVVLDPSAALDLLTRHYEEIGAAAGGGTVTVTPVSVVTGTVEGHAFTAGAMPPVTFALDATALRPSDEALLSTAPTPVDLVEVAPRTFAAAGHSISLVTARMVAGAVLLAALLAFVVAVWLGRAGSGDAAERFVARNATRILPVHGFTPGRTVVDVADGEALHRVAERLDGLVLHQAGPDGSTFAVQDGETTYRFVALRDDAAQKPPVPAPVPRLA